jgi:hypothetical protein
MLIIMPIKLKTMIMQLKYIFIQKSTNIYYNTNLFFINIYAHNLINLSVFY